MKVSEPAFPQAYIRDPETQQFVPPCHPGISTRLYVATQIAAGIVANMRIMDKITNFTIAEEAYLIADALIEREDK